MGNATSAEESSEQKGHVQGPVTAAVASHNSSSQKVDALNNSGQIPPASKFSSQLTATIHGALVPPSPIVGSPLIASDHFAGSSLLQRGLGRAGSKDHGNTTLSSSLGSSSSAAIGGEYDMDGSLDKSLQETFLVSVEGMDISGSKHHGDDTFAQPTHERSYKNSAKIVHAFGPGGLGPLAPIGKVEERKSIPIIVGWTGGGKTVHVTGTFNNWKQKIRLNRSTTDFTTVVDMPPGTHRFKFIVDDEWKCSDDLPIASDADGNLVNYLEVLDEYGDLQGDGLDGLSSYGDGPTISHNVPESPVGSYSTDIPSYLVHPSQSPSSSKNTPTTQSAFPTEPPPQLPPHLEKVLLNSNQVVRDDPSILPVPNHVTLNHLYACSIRDGVMALACTTRYRKKYVTTVLYKPVFS